MIIFDLDGTLANCEHRRHFVDPRKSGYSQLYNTPQCFYSKKWVKFIDNEPLPSEFIPDWKAFYEACEKDTPNFPVCDLLRDLPNDYEIWSGRCESVREKTEKWIRDWLFCSFNSDKLKMRSIGDCTPDEVLKEIWLHQALIEGKTIDFVFDDRPKVIRMWRRNGIFVFNCCQHDEEF